MAKHHQGKEEDCQEKLSILANTVDDFVADLKKYLTDLHSDGQIADNAYKILIDLTNGYWQDKG